MFSYENQIPGTGSDTLPCYGSSGLRSRWLEITVPAETKLTVRVNETDTCILGIGFYSACGNLANPLAQICGYEDVSLSYENPSSSPVTLKVLVNDHPAANHPTIAFTCTPVYPGETCTSAKPAACGDQFAPDWWGPPYQTIAESTDVAPCATAQDLVGHWLKITAQPGQSVTVSVEDFDLGYQTAVAFYEACPPASPISCAACPQAYPCDPTSLTYQNTSGAPKVLYVLVNRCSGSCAWMISVTCAQATKDECAGAEPITCGTTLQGQLLLNATASTPGAYCLSGVPDVWYYVDVPLCGTGINVFYEANGQGFVALYTGPNCNSLTPVACDNSLSEWGRYYASYPTEQNNVRVYIRIGTTDTTGYQNLTLSCFDKLDSMAGCQR